MIFKGFKFGMLLQIAVGPICLFVFQTAVAQGFFPAVSSVLGVALIDALFILVAIWGLGTLLERNRSIKKFIQTFGAIILVLFGVSIVAGAFGISMIPSLDFASTRDFDSLFLRAMLLTVSNPLTILFWAGVFSTKIIEEALNAADLYLFGLGAVLSTLLFLSLVAGIGHFANAFLPQTLLTVFNVAIGFVLIAFGIKTGTKKISPRPA